MIANRRREIYKLRLKNESAAKEMGHSESAR